MLQVKSAHAGVVLPILGTRQCSEMNMRFAGCHHHRTPLRIAHVPLFVAFRPTTENDPINDDNASVNVEQSFPM